MIQDTSPGTLGVRDLKAIAERWPERVDAIEYLRGRMARPRFADTLKAWAVTAGRVAVLRGAAIQASRIALVWIVSAMLAHDIVSIAEGSPWPGQWGANGFLACIMLASAIGFALALWLDDLSARPSTPTVARGREGL